MPGIGIVTPTTPERPVHRRPPIPDTCSPPWCRQEPPRRREVTVREPGSGRELRFRGRVSSRH